MKIQLNFEPGMMDERAAKMLGHLVTRAAQEGGVITLSEVGGNLGGHVAGYIFGQEEPGSGMAAGAAYGQGETVAEALAGALDDLGVAPWEVGL